MTYEMKTLFRERMGKLLPDSDDFNKFSEIIHIHPRNVIRCNTLKVNPEKLVLRLVKRWNIIRPFLDYPEIIIVESDIKPGELGNALEHLLGYYYIQEISSMLPVLLLDPRPGEFILDMCASPGSKTTQIAARMENQGTIIANDHKIDRIRILASNLERCGVTNTIVTKQDAVSLSLDISQMGFKFDKILLDAPCSGEGTLRSSPKTFLIWNQNMVNSLSKIQKRLISSVFKCLKKGGTLVYSTCTHSPEENEEVIDFVLKNFPVKLDSINLPLKCREGITYWDNKYFDNEVKKCCRIYPQDNDSEGFFMAKMTLEGEVQ